MGVCMATCVKVYGLIPCQVYNIACDTSIYVHFLWWVDFKVNCPIYKEIFTINVRQYSSMEKSDFSKVTF